MNRRLVDQMRRDIEHAGGKVNVRVRQCSSGTKVYIYTKRLMLLDAQRIIRQYVPDAEAIKGSGATKDFTFTARDDDGKR